MSAMATLPACITTRPHWRRVLINLASGQPRQLGTVLTDLLALAAIRPSVERNSARLRLSDVPRSCGDASFARTVLQLGTQQYPWMQTLKDVLGYWRTRTVGAASAPDQSGLGLQSST